jgi:uncharacterized protein (DUF1330 family)
VAAAGDSLADRLIAAYAGSHIDASADTFRALSDDAPAVRAIAIVEFVRLRTDAGAKERYDAYVDSMAVAIEATGGDVLTVNDTLMPGLEGLEGFEGGVSWVATAPSTRSYADALLDARVIDAVRALNGAVEEAYVLVGTNRVPDLVKALPPNTPASAFPMERVQGKTPAAIVDDLLSHYPSGGADPTRAMLEAMTSYEGFLDQRLHYINLYKLGTAAGGMANLNEYQDRGGAIAVAHGARPQVAGNVRHQLAGRVRWSRFVVVSWPSFAVFTDLRLDPAYIEEQKHRVVAAEAYGNLITVARMDRESNARPPSAR